MKKFLFAFLALASVSAMAENHVYTKVGADLFTRYNSVSHHYNEFDTNITFAESKGGSGVGIFFEATKNFTPNLELGAGVAFIRRDNSNATSLKKYNINGYSLNGYYLQVPRYSSIPLYLTAKYNFDTNSTIKPYVKFDLGYSFNKINDKNLKLDFYPEKNIMATEIVGKIKAKNGIYTGIGIGAEYNNFLAELSYNFTTSKISGNIDTEIIAGDFNKKYNNKALRLSVGYKFNF